VIISSPLIDLFLPAPQDIAAPHVSRTDIQTGVLSPAGSKITMGEGGKGYLETFVRDFETGLYRRHTR